MELKDFVSETLSQIIDGVKIAQQHAEKAGAKVNPEGTPSSETSRKNGAVYFHGGDAFTVQMIEFDVFVTTVEGDKAEAGTGIFVGPFALGGKTRIEDTNTKENRIKFSVPVQLPGQ